MFILSIVIQNDWRELMIAKKFPGNLDSLSPVRDFVHEHALSAGLDKKSAYNLILAIDEVVTNIINYGYIEAGIEGDVDVFIENEDTAFRVTVEDTAEPFDPRDNELPTEEDLNLPLEDRAIGGLGIFLVFSSVDKFNYEYVDGRNRNIFVMNLNN